MSVDDVLIHKGGPTP